jgi:DNA (cytosine-5)-methyltransferase 1
MLSAELFAGCGGLALGMSRAGYKHALMAEWNADAVETVRHNHARGIEHVASWPVSGRVDVREIDWSKHAGKLSIISGGPPCQPFGIGGSKKGNEDVRDMWPEAIRAIRETGPDGFLFENVRNLAGPKFRTYLDWIALNLEHPSDVRRPGETYAGQLARLRSSTRPKAYNVSWQVVNAADYGAPQIRNRVLIFGAAAKFCGPVPTMPPTHSRDRLLWDQYVTGVYWKKHGLKKRPAPDQDALRVSRLRIFDYPPVGLPWVTVRDALLGLGKPDGRNNHIHQPGAKVYSGHTGSQLDRPSKALKAGDHGVPGGENMMVLDDGCVRYFSTREAARLVGLPDDFEFPRSWTEAMRQLGNAVPAQLAEAAGHWLSSHLKTGESVKPRPRRAA